jgi:hypothetical protein
MVDSAFYTAKTKIKELILIFDENDDIIEGIQEGMKTRQVSKATIEKASGYIKNFTLNYFQGSSLKNIQIQDEKKIMKSSGEFKYDFAHNKLFGRMRMLLKEGEKTQEGILIKGKAGEKLRIRLRYLETEE